MITLDTVFTMATILTLINFTFNFYCCFCTFIIYWPVFNLKSNSDELYGTQWDCGNFCWSSQADYLSHFTLSQSTSQLKGAVDKSGDVDSWVLGHRKHQHSMNRHVVGVWSEQYFTRMNHCTFGWLNIKSFHWHKLLGNKSAMRCIISMN